MKIVKLTAQNFKNLRAVEITPDGNVIKVTGKNGAGKTSVLDSIIAALGGKAKVPGKPIRDGQKRAAVVVETEEYIVRRRFTSAGSTLEVLGTDRCKIKSPQELLASIVGKIAFDPLAFARMSDKDQREMLLELLGLDLSEHDEKIVNLRTERSGLLAEKKRQSDRAENLTWTADAPKESVSVAELTEQLKAANTQNSEYDTYQRVVQERTTKLANMREELLKKQKELADLQEAIAGETSELADIQSTFEGMERADAEAIEKQLGDVERINAVVRANQQYLEAAEAIDTLGEQITSKYHEIQAAEADKANALAGVTMPVPNLSVDENGVLLNGIPLRQVNHAEKVKVSAAIGMAMNPELQVLLMDGNGLDTETLSMIGQMAEDKDYQVWMEVTDESGKVGIFIRDGEVVEAPPEREAVSA